MFERKAEEVNKARGPTTVVISREDVSTIDKQGQPFYDAEADFAFVESFKLNLIEVDNHINEICSGLKATSTGKAERAVIE